jgi:prephenate dehydrogenase
MSAPDAPHFQHVAIIGTGLLGGSLGLALKKRGMTQRIVGVARGA